MGRMASLCMGPRSKAIGSSPLQVVLEVSGEIGYHEMAGTEAKTMEGRRRRRRRRSIFVVFVMKVASA